MNQGRILIILGFVVLIVALGIGSFVLLNGDKEPTAGVIHNAELQVGDKAPDFELYDNTGIVTRLSDFRGEKNVVLAFYPAAWTPV
jgi:cytochrome oxidase Cu insertion factor (SCO1/SenC/PrrC family)